MTLSVTSFYRALEAFLYTVKLSLTVLYNSNDVIEAIDLFSKIYILIECAHFVSGNELIKSTPKKR